MNKKENIHYYYTIFAICFILHLIFALIGWNHSISDIHGFRQTQTAISTYYTIKEGFRIDYITPVLGKPWSIPFEFPLYQWIVASIVLLFKMNLNQAGRLVSLLFFYFSLIPIYILLNFLVSKKSHKLIFLSLILSSPIYIFWSRTFMIESLAFFLSLVFLAAIFKLTALPKKKYIIIACLAGTLAGLVKITTFLIFCFPAVLKFLWCWIQEYRQIKATKKTVVKWLLRGFLIFIIPLVINICWIKYADNLKSLNPIGSGITSKALRTWNFGTLKQRLELNTWKRFYSHSTQIIWHGNNYNIRQHIALFIFEILILLLYISTKQKYYKKVLLSFLCFCIGPLVFTNLYSRHNYYWYANSIFLLLSLGFIIITLLENKKYQLISKIIIFPALLLTMHCGYLNYFYKDQANINQYYPSLISLIRQHTNENDVLLAKGFDWSSELPYYSQRKALMLSDSFTFENKNFQKTIENMKNEKITALAIRCNNCKKSENSTFIEKCIKKFNFSKEPIYKDQSITLYLKRNTKKHF